MAKISDVLNVARSQLGYTETGNNDNKFGQEYGLNNQPWCVIFIWWIFKHANASNLFYGGNKIALCSSLYNYHKANGQAVSKYALTAGDVVFFNFSGGSSTQHVGIVESRNGSTIQTIEGNTSSGTSGSQANGDGVYRRTRNIKYIVCAYRPNYDDKSSVSTNTSNSGGSVRPYSDTVKSLQQAFRNMGASISVDGLLGPRTRVYFSKYILKNGKRNSAVTWLQNRLNALGYNCGAVDGIFGTKTKNAVISFQKAKGLDADGEVGPNTYEKLCGF